MDYAFHLMVMVGIYVILTLSLNLVVGYTGLAVLSQAGFACVGAYTSALLALDFGAPAWLGAVAGGALAALTGGGLALCTSRLKGDYLALATFGFGVIVYSVAKNWTQLTRGPLGLPGIPPFRLFSFGLSSAWAFQLLVGVAAAATYWVLERIVRSPFGRVLAAIRDDELAAEALGKNVGQFKVQAMMVSAFFAGVAGSFYAHYVSFIDPTTFSVMESVAVLLMVVFGGMGSLVGSVMGASVLVLLPEALRFLGLPNEYAAPVRQMIYGLLLVLVVLKRPQGLMGKAMS